MQDGTIVPVDITCLLLKQEMKGNMDKVFLIDGFPRNEDNLNGWMKNMSNLSILIATINLYCERVT